MHLREVRTRSGVERERVDDLGLNALKTQYCASAKKSHALHTVKVYSVSQEEEQQDNEEGAIRTISVGVHIYFVCAPQPMINSPIGVTTVPGTMAATTIPTATRPRSVPARSNKNED